MSSNFSLDNLQQFSEKDLRKYEAIALSMSISFELEDYIKEKGISKQELAEAAGVSASYLSQVFSGSKLFNLSMLAGISQKYGIRYKMEIEETAEDYQAIYDSIPFNPAHFKKPMMDDVNSFQPFDSNSLCCVRKTGEASGC